MEKILTEDQSVALEKMILFSTKASQRIFTLSGFAGVGKTTVMTQFARDVVSRGVPVVLTAPTNKAVKVLDDMRRDINLAEVKCRTIYSLLGLKVDINNEIKRVNFDAAKPYEPFKKGVIIVDEASMVGEDLFRYLASDILNLYPEVKIIFVGDPMQLPPVGEKEAVPFSGGFEMFSLTEIVRQAEENPIIRLTATIRKCIQDGILPSFGNDIINGCDGVFSVNGKTFTHWMQQHFPSAAYKQDNTECRCISWRNRTVDSYNALIRRAIYGEKVSRQKYITDERVTAVSPIVLLTEDPYKTEIALCTDEEATVLDFQKEKHPLYPNAEAYAVLFKRDDDSEVTVYTTTEESISWVAQTVRQKKEEAMQDRRKWFFYYKFIEAFSDIRVYGNRVCTSNIRPAHTLTAHKSQGSTFNRSFVDAVDILENSNRIEALKCLYVAVSRARRAVAIKSSE